jgi:Tfp pilus assembly protein PilO
MSGRLRYCFRHPAVRSGAWACAVAAGAAVVSLALWWPAHDRMQNLQSQFSDAKRELIDRQQLMKGLTAYESAQKSAASLQAKLEYGGTQAQLVEDISRLARSQGVRIVSEAYEEDRRRGGSHSVLNADLAVQGDYRSLRGFIDGLGSLPSWSEIDSVELERAREAGVINGKVRIVTYRQSQQAIK